MSNRQPKLVLFAKLLPCFWSAIVGIEYNRCSTRSGSVYGRLGCLQFRYSTADRNDIRIEQANMVKKAPKKNFIAFAFNKNSEIAIHHRISMPALIQ